MSQRLVTDFVNTNIPGAYPNTKVKSNPVGLSASGIVVLIGEADGGDYYGNVALAQNWFDPSQMDQVVSKYGSGQIVDAFSALSAPSADADITGSANKIYIVKTNQSGKAQSAIDTDYGTLKDKNFGVGGNQYKFNITSIAAEVAPTLTGNTIPSLGAALNGTSFTVRLNGAVATVVTLSGTSTLHDTVAHLVSELTPLLPAGIAVTAGTAPNTIALTVTADAAAYRKGWGKSFELIDSTPGNLAALGIPAGLVTSSQEPGVELNFTRSDTGLNETIDVNTDIALMVGYAGTTATLTINQSTKTLTTTVVGGSGTSLTINMAQYRTIADLAGYINAQTGYSAIASATAQQQPTSSLDTVTAQGICCGVAGNKPGRVKSAAATFAAKMATSRALTFTATASAGLPNPMSAPSYLSGGTRGGTASADIVNAVAQIAGIQCNIIVPCFSRDSSADIADGMTDSSSTYTIAALHAVVKNHVLQYSTPKLKKHRMAILSIWDTYQNCKNASQGLASYRCSLTCQRPTQVSSAGVITSFLPWYGAAVAAGMQAGGFYKAIFNKAANITSFQDPSGFDSGNPGNVEDALSAGLLILSNDTTRNYWVSDQTTYGYDANFVYNSLQAVYVSDLLALDLADSFQKAFVGQSLADVDQGTALSFLSQKMDGYKKLKMIASSDDAPLGWKNGKVGITAPEMDVSVEVKLATAIYFVPINLNISQVQLNG